MIGDLPKVKSLVEPMKKMSKSDHDEKSRINIIDTPDIIRLVLGFWEVSF